jgi:hypothetical protein
MKRIAWLTLLAAMLLVSAASAAYVEINAPKTVYVGDPLKVTGTTIVGGLTKPSLNPGFSTDVVLYSVKHTKSEVDRKTIVVQEDGTFSATFDTRRSCCRGLHGRDHRSPSRRTPLGAVQRPCSSSNWSIGPEDLRITSPLVQEFDGSLDIAGAQSADIGGAGVRIQVEYATAPPSTGLSISGPMLMGGSL